MTDRADATTTGPSEALPDGGEDRRRAALDHLQLAALEFIEAARAVLDVAEEAVREPGGVAAILGDTLGGLAAVFGAAGPRRPPEAGGDDTGAKPAGGVQHIRVS